MSNAQVRGETFDSGCLGQTGKFNITYSKYFKLWTKKIILKQWIRVDPRKLLVTSCVRDKIP